MPTLRARSCRESHRRCGAACAGPYARSADARRRSVRRQWWLGWLQRSLLHRCLIAAVTAEMARRRELAELVSDHIFGDVHRNMHLAVVHADRVADHSRNDRGGAAPRFHHALLTRFVESIDFLDQ